LDWPKAEMTYTNRAAGKHMEQEATEERILGGPDFVYRVVVRGSRDAERWQQLLESRKAIKVATSRRIRGRKAGAWLG